MAVNQEALARLISDRQARADMLMRLDAEDARESGSASFAAFVRQAWQIVDQAPLVWNWYLHALASHLDAVARGKIKRFVGNGPPRHGKSNLFAIMWPAWVWTWAPSTKFIYLSYSSDLVTEHSVKCRALIESRWYQDLYRPQWRLGHAPPGDGDNAPWRFAHGNRQDDFVNTAGGRRIASPIKSGVTGRGADIIAIDDPLSAEEAGSTSARETARRVIVQAVATRFNDRATARAAMLMQRVDKEDPTKMAIEGGWTQLCVPAEFVLGHRSVTTIDGEEFWRDPREVDGEILPGRLTAEDLREIRLSFGPVGYAAQYQQQPVEHVSAGMYFQRGKFEVLVAAPLDVEARVRSWDLASTRGAGDWTVGVKLARLKSGKFVVEDVVRAQLDGAGVRELVLRTAQADGYDCRITIPQDPGQAGKDQAQDYVTRLAGWTVELRRPDAKKELRAGPASAQVMAGNMAVVRAPWNEPFFQVLDAFPDPAVHDDDVDAFADAVAHLAQKVKQGLALWEDVEL